MAKPTKHRDKWRIRWTDHAGKRQSEVYDRYKDAGQALRRHQSEVHEIRCGERVPVARGKTFNDLCDYWLARAGLGGNPSAAVCRVRLSGCCRR
jgi:hypothetical protein